MHIQISENNPVHSDELRQRKGRTKPDERCVFEENIVEQLINNDFSKKRKGYKDEDDLLKKLMIANGWQSVKNNKILMLNLVK